MSDKDALAYLFPDGNFKILKASKTNLPRLKEKFPEIYSYLINRYDDNDTGKICEIAYRLANCIDIRPKCMHCGNKVKFYGRFSEGYSECCSSKECQKWLSKHKIKMTSIARYGAEHWMKKQEFKEKVEKTNLLRYGAKHLMHNEDIAKKAIENAKQAFIENREKILEKKKQTCLKRYGVEFASQSKKIIDKAKQTCLKKYGHESYAQTEEWKDKVKQTCLKKYGCFSPNQSKEVIDKKKAACIEKYGVDSYAKTNEWKERCKKTCLEKYGVEHVFQSQMFKSKSKQTMLSKYGHESHMQNESIKEKTKMTCLRKFKFGAYVQSAAYLDKMMNLYGKDNPMKIEEFKSLNFENKIKNGTCNTSKLEEDIYRYLSSRFGKSNVERQYICERYNHHCDFYIKHLDLFIEVQGTWTHGNKPYDANDEECKALVEKWQREIDATNSLYYKHALRTYATADVKKREEAKKNGLNFFEFFGNFKDFESQLNAFLQ